MISAALKNRILKTLLPPPEMEIWQWANKHMRLSVENSAQPGKYDVSKTEYIKSWHEAVKNPRCKEVVIQSSSQVGKTTFLNAIVGYVATEEPSPILYILPELTTAEEHSKQKLAPLFRDTRVLAELLDTKSRDAGNKILLKHFSSGCVLTICGANAPSSLSAKAVRFVLIDELSRFPNSSGSEGDPVSIAKRRMATYHNKMLVACSTPTNVGTCKTHMMMSDEITRRHEFRVPCPHCNELIKLEWSQMDWEEKKPETARYQCQECDKFIKDSHKTKMIKNGKWICLNPEVGEFRMGFQISGLYSPWVRFSELVREHELALRDPSKMKVFTNTMLGEPYESKTSGVESQNIFMRRENYPKNIDIPSGGLVLTCGVDVQIDRLECETVAWGGPEGKESWSVRYDILWGSPSDESTWKQLDDLLDKNFLFQWSFTQKIAATVVDTGYSAHEVYAYVKRNRGKRRVFASKGMPGDGRAMVSAPVKRRTGRDRVPVDLYTLGTFALKREFYDALKIEKGKPGYCHFPVRDNYDKQHFKNLVSEKSRIVLKNGYPVTEWFLPSGNNEQLDCRLMARAGLILLNPIFKSLEKRLLQEKENIEELIESGYEGAAAQNPISTRKKKISPRVKTPRAGVNSVTNWWK
ncbi:MAG: phage terminase large subunit family protein [Oligoflexales bacterium]